MVHLDPIICCKLLLAPFRLGDRSFRFRDHGLQFTCPHSGAKWKYQGKHGKCSDTWDPYRDG